MSRARSLFFWMISPLILVSCQSDYSTPTSPSAVVIEPVSEIVVEAPPEQPPQFEGELKQDQTLSEVLRDHGLPDGTVYEVTHALGSILDLRKLRPGNYYRLELTSQGDFKHLSYHLSREQKYQVFAAEGTLQARRDEVDVRTQPYVVSGTIHTSLYDAVLGRGESVNVAMSLIDAFQWDINFYTDAQPGDTFEALIEKVFVDGHEERLGRVFMARYHGKTTGQKDAVLFRDDFFDGHGQYLQQSFLTTPLDILKVTSRFGQRFHPILGKWRAHKGIDYGARSGTPVWSVAGGTVVYAGNRGDGYGKQVMIEHTRGYFSRYAHLSRISVARGQKVKQKMKVGDVGATGQATAPHLHFEIVVNNHHVNPANQKMLPKIVKKVKDMPDFLAERDRLSALIELTQIAQRLDIRPEVSVTY